MDGEYTITIPMEHLKVSTLMINQMALAFIPILPILTMKDIGKMKDKMDSGMRNGRMAHFI